MRTKQIKKTLSFFLCMMLIVAMAFITNGCSDDKEKAPVNDSGEVTILGEGSKQFYFTVVDKSGNATNFEIYTDSLMVGDALIDLELISGEAGPYGLYVKEVNGISADYDKDGVYWAFYINGEYATVGVDETEIKEGERYSFKVEK